MPCDPMSGDPFVAILFVTIICLQFLAPLAPLESITVSVTSRYFPKQYYLLEGKKFFIGQIQNLQVP